jgi:hypothetical protein
VEVSPVGRAGRPDEPALAVVQAGRLAVIVVRQRPDSWRRAIRIVIPGAAGPAGRPSASTTAWRITRSALNASNTGAGVAPGPSELGRA